jgi:hypothetical protein
MGDMPGALREDVDVAARAKIIEWLQRDEAFIFSISFREQWFHSCRYLCQDHTPVSTFLGFCKKQFMVYMYFCEGFWHFR